MGLKVYQHQWGIDGPLGLKLKPRSGDKDGKQGVFVSGISDDAPDSVKSASSTIRGRCIHQVIHGDYHAAGLQQQGYDYLLDCIKTAGRPVVLVFGDGRPDPPILSEGAVLVMLDAHVCYWKQS